MVKKMLDRELFRNPPPAYRGTDLWMMNTALDEDALAMQLNEMKKAGIGTFIARTYNGHQSDYPGEQYHRAIAFVIRKAAELQMEVYLQAGYMPSGMPDIPEKYQLTALMRSPEGEYGGEGRVIRICDGYVYYLYALDDMLDIMSKEAADYYVDTAYEKMWSCFRQEFGKTVTSVWVDEPYLCYGHYSWSPCLPEKFREMWGYDVTRDLPLLFGEGEEAETMRYRYLRCVGELLDGAYYSAVRNWCHDNGLHFSGHLMGEDTLWHQTVFGASVMRHYKYFDIPGVDFLTGSLYWYHDVGNAGCPNTLLFVTTPLQCSGAAHQAGKNEVLAEMYGVSSQDLGTDRQREIFDFLVALGINRKCIHAMFSSLAGKRKYLYVPDIFYQQPYWNDYRLYTDYQARVSMFMREGTPEKDILLLHPIEDCFRDIDIRNRVNPDSHTEWAARERGFNKLLCDLLGGHWQFDLGDEETLSSLGFITKDRIAVGEMQYQTVIVPPVTSMRETTAKLLLAHCENGGRVIFLDGRPTMLDAQKDETGLLDALLRHPGSAFVHGYAALSGALSETVRPCVRLISQNGPDLWMNVRRTGDGYHVFLLNRGKKDESVSLGLSEICKAVCCNAERGTIEDVSCFRKDGMTAAEIVIPAGRSAMLAFIKSEEASCFVPMQSAQRMDISDGWTAGKQSAPNAFLLEYCSYRLNDDDEWSKEYPQIAIRRILKNSAYSGTLSLRYTFTVSEMPDSPVSLVLENAGDFRIALNGVRIDTQNTEGYYIDLSFTRVPLGHSLRIGTNELILTGEFRQPQTAVRSLFSLFQNEGGTELSDPYLIGDFGVSVCRTYSHTPLLRISPDYALVKKNAPSAEELVTSGYPFYAGSLTFTKTVDLGEFPEGAEWKFRIGDFRGCLAKISVNGSPEIPMIFSPYEADITPYLKPGRNELTLTYTNTLYNLLGPWHYPQGERSGTWQDSAWTGEERDAGDPDVWYIGKYADTSGYIGDYHLKSQGMSDITLEYELPL